MAESARVEAHVFVVLIGLGENASVAVDAQIQAAAGQIDPDILVVLLQRIQGVADAVKPFLIFHFFQFDAKVSVLIQPLPDDAQRPEILFILYPANHIVVPVFLLILLQFPDQAADIDKTVFLRSFHCFFPIYTGKA